MNEQLEKQFDTSDRVSHLKIENDAMYYLLDTTPKRYTIKNRNLANINAHIPVAVIDQHYI